MKFPSRVQYIINLRTFPNVRIYNHVTCLSKRVGSNKMPSHEVSGLKILCFKEYLIIFSNRIIAKIILARYRFHCLFGGCLEKNSWGVMKEHKRCLDFVQNFMMEQDGVSQAASLFSLEHFEHEIWVVFGRPFLINDVILHLRQQTLAHFR